MKFDILQKILIVASVVFFAAYLPVPSEARTEQGEEFVQSRNGEGRIMQINAESIVINDIYFKLSEETKYVDTEKGYLKLDMYVSYIVNEDETVSRIQVLDRDVPLGDQDGVNPPKQIPSGEDSMYQEDGVWKN